MVRDKLQGLDLNLLVTLDALVRYRSVTRTAEYLDVTQGAVSQALSRLRHFFGDSLLIKAGHCMEPTPLGEELGAALEDILSTVRSRVLRREAFDPRLLQRPIRLCLTDMGEFAILPDLLDRLSRLAPGCEVRTRTFANGEFKGAMESGEIDLAVGGPIADLGDLMQHKLYEHHLVALVSSASLLSSPLSVADYTSAGHIVIDSPNVRRVAVDRVLAGLGAKRRVVLRTPNALVLPFILESRPDLMATIPRLLAERYVKVMDVRVMDLGFALPTIPVFQYWHRRYDSHQFSKWLRELVRNTVRERVRAVLRH